MKLGHARYAPATRNGGRRHRWLGSEADFDDELIELIEDVADAGADARTLAPWRVLIADDDPSVHDATVAALAGQRIHDRPLSFLHTYSASETLALLANEAVHLLLLDVVMETPEAGLRAVNEIRHGLGLLDVKIVIRTGQPGLRPEQEIRRSYAIDGYANKAMLTRSMLRDVIASALQTAPPSPDGAN